LPIQIKVIPFERRCYTSRTHQLGKR
jgi:hypothetical protein